MSISTKVGIVSARTTVGSQAYTGVGFQPEAVIFFASERAGTGGSTAIAQIGMGFASGSAARAVAVTSRNGGTTAATVDEECRMSAAGVTLLNSYGTLVLEATVTSLDADGFTLDFTTVSGHANQIGYLALGGADLTNVAVGDFTTGTSTGNVDVTSPGFTPDVVLLMHTGVGSALPYTSDTGSTFGFGVGVSASERWASVRQLLTATVPTEAASQQVATAVLLGLTSSNGQDFVADYSGGITNGFRLNFSDAPASSVRVAYLALKGGKFCAGLETQKTSTGTKDTTVTGTPRAALLVGALKTAGSGIDTSSPAITTIGASDGTTQKTVSSGAADAASPSDVYTDLSGVNAIVKCSIDSTRVATGQVSFTAGTMTTNWTTADSTASEFGYLTFGDTLGSSTAVSQASETDVAQDIGRVKALALPTATEADSAHVITSTFTPGDALAGESTITFAVEGDADLVPIDIGGDAVQSFSVLADLEGPGSGGGLVPARFRTGAADRRPHTVVRLLGADGAWTDVGTAVGAAARPEGLTLEASASGPASGGFAVRRDGSRPWPDLAPFSEMQVEVGGEGIVWGGRIQTAPAQDGSVSVQGTGYQADLDLDFADDWFVHSQLSDWRDARSYPGASLGLFTAAGQVGPPSFGWANGAVPANNSAAGITLDLGPGRTAAAISVEFTSQNAASLAYIYVRSHPDLAMTTWSDASVDTWNVETSPIVATFGAGAGRYVSLFLYRVDGLGTAMTTDRLFIPSAIRVYSAAGYMDAGGRSLVKASDVVRVARDACPGLSTSNARISDSGFIDVDHGIPHLFPTGDITPRGLISAANAFHNWHAGVDARRRVFFEPRSLEPVAVVGSWGGSTLSGLSSGSADDVYNRVIVEGTDGYGQALRVVRTATAPVLDRFGLTHTAKLTVQSAATEAILTLIGDAWLAERSRTPFRGTLTLTGIGGARRIPGGNPMHPAGLLLHVGRRIRFATLIDPDTGGIGRDGVIANVRYDDDATTAVVQIDNDYTAIDALLTRWGVLQGQAVR